VKRVPLINGGWALVDDEDFDRVKAMRWRRMKSGYIVCGVYSPATKNTASILMHRFIMAATDSEEIDHEDNARANNQKYNLRRATRTQNNGNSRGWHKATSSRFKGVTWHKRGKKWMAHIATKYLGLFEDERDAARAYNKAALEYFGEFALINKDV
jgi:hypothetical protein